MHACMYLCRYGYIEMCTDRYMYVHVYMRACTFLGQAKGIGEMDTRMEADGQQAACREALSSCPSVASSLWSNCLQSSFFQKKKITTRISKLSIRELISRVKPKKGEEKHNKSENTMNSGYTHIFKTMRLFLVEGKPGESPPSGSFFARNLIKRIFFCQNQASKHHTHTHVQHSHTHTHTQIPTWIHTYMGWLQLVGPLKICLFCKIQVSFVGLFSNRDPPI